MAKKYTNRVAIPKPEQMNGGLNYPTVDFMVDLLGKPRTKMTADCAAVTNKELSALMVTNYDVGPFKVSGLRKAAESLERIFRKVFEEELELYRVLGTAGMLCVRNKRGASGFNPSNHSWGAAIDLTISGQLDERADAKCQEGLMILYKYFHAEGWFWGAEYRGPFEDSMHFEVARETLQRWYGHKQPARSEPMLFLNGVIIRGATYDTTSNGGIIWSVPAAAVCDVLGFKANLSTTNVTVNLGVFLKNIDFKVVATSNRLKQRNRFDIRAEKV